MTSAASASGDTAKPSGPAAAAVLAAGIGVLVLGLMTTGAETLDGLRDFLRFDDNFGLGVGVGPLSGKASVATLVYVVAFIGLGLLWRGRDVSFLRAFWVAMLLLAAGLVLTFPPVFEALAV